MIYFSTTVNPAQLESTYASAQILSPGTSSFMAPAVSFGNSNPNNVINMLGPIQNITPALLLNPWCDDYCSDGFYWIAHFTGAAKKANVRS